MSIEGEVGKLERRLSQRERVIVWREFGQIVEPAIAARFLDLKPLVVGWMDQPAET